MQFVATSVRCLPAPALVASPAEMHAETKQWTSYTDFLLATRIMCPRNVNGHGTARSPYDPLVMRNAVSSTDQMERWKRIFSVYRLIKMYFPSLSVPKLGHYTLPHRIHMLYAKSTIWVVQNPFSLQIPKQSIISFNGIAGPTETHYVPAAREA